MDSFLCDDIYFLLKSVAFFLAENCVDFYVLYENVAYLLIYMDFKQRIDLGVLGSLFTYGFNFTHVAAGIRSTDHKTDEY